MTTDAPTSQWLDAFFNNVLLNLGLQPTSWRLDFLKTWSQYETSGGTAGPSYNPLATTLNAQGATTYNSHGVKNYPDIPTGAMATALTLQHGTSENPNLYSPIIDTLKNEIIGPGTATAIYNPNGGQYWGTGGFANLINEGWSPSAAQGQDIPNATLIGFPGIPTPPNPLTDPGGFTDWMRRFFLPIPGISNSPILPIPDLQSIAGKAGVNLNPVQGAASIVGALFDKLSNIPGLKALGSILQWIADYHNWFKLGFYLLGGLMIMGGLYALFKSNE